MGSDGTDPPYDNRLPFLQRHGADICEVEIMPLTPDMNVRLGLVRDDNRRFVNVDGVLQHLGISFELPQQIRSIGNSLIQLHRGEAVLEENLPAHQCGIIMVHGCQELLRGCIVLVADFCQLSTLSDGLCYAGVVAQVAVLLPADSLLVPLPLLDKVGCSDCILFTYLVGTAGPWGIKHGAVVVEILPVPLQVIMVCVVVEDLLIWVVLIVVLAPLLHAGMGCAEVWLATDQAGSDCKDTCHPENHRAALIIMLLYIPLHLRICKAEANKTTSV